MKSVKTHSMEEDSCDSRHSVMSRALIALVLFYRRHISSKSAPRCRFAPTCSAFALEALEKYGALKGSALSIWRILRCNPFCKGGYDPVP